jgi:hypothetical protein
MSKFQKNSVIILSVSILALTILGLWGSKDFLYSNGLPMEHRSVVLNQGQTIGQVFKATSNNLKKVEVLMESVAAKTKGSFTVEDLEGTTIREGHFVVGKNQNIIKFEFEPIGESDNELFYIHSKIDPQYSGAIRFFVASEPMEGHIKNNHKEEEGDLVMRLGYKLDLSSGEFLSILSQRMSQYKPAWVKAPYLYVYWISFIMSVVWVIVLMAEEFLGLKSSNPSLKK